MMHFFILSPLNMYLQYQQHGDILHNTRVLFISKCDEILRQNRTIIIHIACTFTQYLNSNICVKSHCIHKY